MASPFRDSVTGIPLRVAKSLIDCRLPILIILAALLGGCGKKKEAPASETAKPAASPGTAATEAPAQATPRKYETGGQIDLVALNQTLRDYVRLKNQVPADINELVTSGYLTSLPKPPPGKRFVIRMLPLGYQVFLED